MAIELVSHKLTGLVADGDLSTKQFYCVKMSTTDDTVSLCDTDGEVILGVLCNKPDAANKAAEVAALGQVKIEAGEALVIQSTIVPDLCTVSAIWLNTSKLGRTGDCRV